MTTINSLIPTTAGRDNVPVVPAGSNSDALSQEDFLALMTAQLRAQDPFDPVDNQAMVAQMAQLSSASGIEDMNSALQSIAGQITEQTALLNQIRDQAALASANTEANPEN